MMSAIDHLKFCANVLNEQRFAGTDQNPKGIRDILSYAIFRVESELRNANDPERVPDASFKHDYLGDGVYGYTDGYQVWIYTSDGITRSKPIAIEPAVYVAIGRMFPTRIVSPDD